ncbi:hypothetical protein [Calycomorphotria hydatis]|uniref:Phage head-tail joining protein n=1 Tax=Calycomorphotria hydatis TaxID=2528027 RepID=A0A517TFC2_9PLAN|nr:hypothetical protein [Calycomorphotria hydatis]QDT67065.1 hypothetical protein V22_43370 [Calycomorphotria hydatis]
MSITELIFNDWSETIVARLQVESINSETGSVSVAVTEVSITAIVGPLQLIPTNSTGSQHRSAERSFLIQTTEIPENFRPPAAQIIHEGIAYKVISNTHSSDGETTLLQCRSESSSA